MTKRNNFVEHYWTTRLVYDESLWVWKCENCNGKMCLPGISPSVKMLVQSEWNYCPHCGEKIDYSKTQNSIHKTAKWDDSRPEKNMNQKDLIGKTIKTINIDGFSVEILFTDGTKFVYEASDGGFSYWKILKDGEIK